MRFFKHRLVIAVLAAMAGAAGWLIVTNLTPEPRDLREPLPHHLAVSDIQFKTSMAALFGSNVLPGNRIETLVNGNAIFPAMLRAVRDAKNTITFETYIYWRGEIATQFAQVLAQKASEGVSVKVLLDWVGSIPMEEQLVEQMQRAGVEVVRFRPVTWRTVDKVNNRTHRKLLVVDGRIGFTGGVGIGDEWNGDARTAAEWRDTHYRLEGPVVAELQSAFAEHWIEATGELLMGDRFFPTLQPAGDLDGQVVASSTHQRNVMHLMLMTALAAAETNIRIGTPYFVPDAITRRQLLEARRRGVQIDILVPGEKTDARIVQKASRHVWGELLEAGIRIHEFDPTMYHAKLVIIDELWTSIGSTNIDDRALRLNDETNLNAYHASFAREQVAIFEADLKRATPYTLAMWNERFIKERVSGWLASLFRSQI
ncbi:cardiolipin synthase [Bosea sp. AAP35]|uniref:phospholipase D-like domain-containing protein n=1 Tax=Bosea sp. AAP35 TaxID=1523417 RepID=UPI0006B92ED2|nr:phospholipase D-like domain-containing protein [Bosea sp. AAP35]KPF67365.1 cardiolipin synthase [Bosea sp. AAP35]